MLISSLYMCKKSGCNRKQLNNLHVCVSSAPVMANGLMVAPLHASLVVL